MAADTITTRALNRALLARQMLLRRETIPPLAAIERLIAMQSQQPRPPFIGLWTRLEDFHRAALLQLIHGKDVVRVTFLRGTLHLMSTADYLAFRATIHPALTAGMQSILKARGAGFELDPIVTAASECFAAQPRTFTEVRTALLSRFPDLDERAMGYAARMRLPLVIAPDASDYGYPSDPRFTTAQAHLGQPPASTDHSADLILRYLAAFGPATVIDAQAWSGLAQLKPVFENLRPQLRVFRDGKRELFDVPGAPLPPEDTPAPVRFLPGFDNAILAHKDRVRIIADEHRPLVTTKNLQVLPTFLIDGFVAGTWDLTRRKDTATVELKPFAPLRGKVKQEVEQEANRLAGFLSEG